MPLKIGNPTSQCALLGLKLVQLSTLTGRIFFCHSGQISDGVHTELIRSLYTPSLHIYSVPTPSELFHLRQKKILPASVLNWTNFKHIRAHWLVGFPILVAFGCTFIHRGVHTRMHMYWGRSIHYRGCTFIAGGVHTRTHVYWGGVSTTGGVPSWLGVCIPGCICTGGGASTTGGVPS